MSNIFQRGIFFMIGNDHYKVNFREGDYFPKTLQGEIRTGMVLLNHSVGIFHGFRGFEPFQSRAFSPPGEEYYEIFQRGYDWEMKKYIWPLDTILEKLGVHLPKYDDALRLLNLYSGKNGTSSEWWVLRMLAESDDVSQSIFHDINGSEKIKACFFVYSCFGYSHLPWKKRKHSYRFSKISEPDANLVSSLQTIKWDLGEGAAIFGCGG